MNQLPKTKLHRYVTFDADKAGVNNIRLVFEYVVVIAAITGRTLVLPPKSSWYLINHGPMPKELQGGFTHISDLYDIDALAKVIPVINTEEFIDEAFDHISIPEAFLGDVPSTETANREFVEAWSSWLLKNTELPGWNPYDTVIAVPSIDKAQCGPHFEEAYLDFRTPVEFTPKINAAPVLHFPSNGEYRSLGPVATMLACADETLPKLARRLIKHHVRIHQDIIDVAEVIVERLKAKLEDEFGTPNYDAIHIRRNDFQYEQTQIGVKPIADNIMPLLDRDLPIYIATDEDREEIYSDLRRHLGAPIILSWRDISGLSQRPIPYAWIGPIEQLVCAPARRFIGTDLSTFTSYIHRLRGYLPAADDNAYYHSEVYSNASKRTQASDYRGRDYLREHPLFWQSC